MKTKRIMVALIAVITMMTLLSSCKDKTTEPDVTTDFELNGTWYGTDYNPHDGGTPVDFTFTFTNTEFNATYGEDDLAASIKSYDNATNTLVFLWTLHPAEDIQDMYQKFTWTENRVSGITVQPYTEQETQAAANSTADFGGYPTVDMHRANAVACATPIFTPASGTYTSVQSVSISCSTSGATIRYTTNGDEPTESSTQYSSPITVSSTATFKAKAYKTGWAASATASATYTISIPPPPANFVYVPGGIFTMGDTRGQGYSNELPTHSVTLNSFYIGKYEVTQAEYSQYMTPGSSWTSFYGLGGNYPAYYVSWYAILKYCNLRSMAEGLTPVYTISGSTNPASWGAVPTSNNSTWDAAICNWSANGYRLPTEAEWEYAARGATNTPDYTYSGSDDINAVAWYSGNNSTYASKPVGTKADNGLGIYDMSGNLWEWCWDWYGNSYYSSSPGSNPTGPASGSYRLLRGGFWYNYATNCRVSYRVYDDPYYGSYGSGFRLCRATN